MSVLDSYSQKKIMHDLDGYDGRSFNTALSIVIDVSTRVSLDGVSEEYRNAITKYASFYKLDMVKEILKMGLHADPPKARDYVRQRLYDFEAFLKPWRNPLQ